MDELIKLLEDGDFVFYSILLSKICHSGIRESVLDWVLQLLLTTWQMFVNLQCLSSSQMGRIYSRMEKSYGTEYMLNQDAFLP